MVVLFFGIVVVMLQPLSYGEPYRVALNTEDGNVPETIDVSIALNAEDGNVPEWIDVLPAGETIEGRDGRVWINKDPQVVVRAFESNGADLPVDMEHATELKAPEGDPAPAVGWIKELRVTEDGRTQARVDWTPRGNELVAGKAYRYVSPVFQYSPTDGTIIRLLSVGLTNRPNLQLKALNHKQPKPNLPMDETQLKALCQALGIAENSSAEQVLGAVNKLKDERATAMNRANHPSPEQFVTRADYDVAMNRAKTAEENLKKQSETARNQEIDTFLDSAVEDGKIAPASKDHYQALCRQGEDSFESVKKLVASAPQIATNGELPKSKQPAGNNPATALNAEERALCEQMGVSEAEFIETKKAEQAQA